MCDVTSRLRPSKDVGKLKKKSNCRPEHATFVSQTDRAWASNSNPIPTMVMLRCKSTENKCVHDIYSVQHSQFNNIMKK